MAGPLGRPVLALPARLAEMPDPDLYRILQVHPEADPEVIQAAYRRLAQRHHPDAAGGSESRMAELNAAYAVLIDPVRRAEYDRQRADGGIGGGRADRTPPMEGSPFPSGGRAGEAGSGRGPVVPPEETSPYWGSGRNPVGTRYDPRTMARRQETGSAGPPPGQPSGSVINFGRYAGWSLGEIARRDLDFLEWLDRMTIGRPYQQEIDLILRRAGRRRTAPAQPDRRGLFRRR
jgi:curved DNA-binding protein CbpA